MALQFFQLPQVNPEPAPIGDARAGRAPVVCSSCFFLCAAGLCIVYPSPNSGNRARSNTFASSPFQTPRPVQGRPSMLEPQVEHALGLEDYILCRLQQTCSPRRQFLLCYYASLAKATRPHSAYLLPRGGGWLMPSSSPRCFKMTNRTLPFRSNRPVIDPIRQEHLSTPFRAARPTGGDRVLVEVYLFTGCPSEETGPRAPDPSHTSSASPN